MVVLIGRPVPLEIVEELIPGGKLVSSHVAHRKGKAMIDAEDDGIILF